MDTELGKGVKRMLVDDLVFSEVQKLFRSGFERQSEGKASWKKGLDVSFDGKVIRHS